MLNEISSSQKDEPGTLKSQITETNKDNYQRLGKEKTRQLLFDGGVSVGATV